MDNRFKKGLKRIVKRRCTTIFIGALDSIENKLGKLWGIEKDLTELTDREKAFLELWKELRREILDKGNYQTKSLMAELDIFDVSMRNNYYEVEFTK